GIGRDAVVAHEQEQLIAGDAAEPASGHPKSLELTRIKAANNGLLADLANLGRFAGRKYSLHLRTTALPSRRCSSSQRDPRSLVIHEPARKFLVLHVTLDAVFPLDRRISRDKIIDNSLDM